MSERENFPPGAADWKAPVGESAEEPKAEEPKAEEPKAEEPKAMKEKQEKREGQTLSSPTIEQYKKGLELRIVSHEDTKGRFAESPTSDQDLQKDRMRMLDVEAIGIAAEMDKARLATIPLVELEEDPDAFIEHPPKTDEERRWTIRVPGPVDKFLSKEGIYTPGLEEEFRSEARARLDEVVDAKRSPERVVQELTYDLSVIEERIVYYNKEFQRLKQIVNKRSPGAQETVEEMDARLSMETIQNKNIPRQEELKRKVLERITRETRGSTEKE